MRHRLDLLKLYSFMRVAVKEFLTSRSDNPMNFNKNAAGPLFYLGFDILS